MLTKRYYIALFLLFNFCLSAQAIQALDSLAYRVTFNVNSSKIELNLNNNSKTFDRFYSDFKDLCSDNTVSSIHIYLRGNSSIEGPTFNSFKLAENRAESTVEHILHSYLILPNNLTVVPPLPMMEQTEKSISSFTDPVPGVDFASISRIINTVGGSDVKRAILTLDKDGKNWQWFSSNVLKPACYCEITIRFKREKSEEAETVLAVAPVETAPEPATAPTEANGRQPLPRTWEVRLGTNLLYDIVTVANLTLEVGFAKHFAFNILTTYSPWDIQPDLKLRTLLIQPEFRGYFAEDFRGHFIGIEGHCGWYDVAFKGSTRYQDKDGNTPLWGAGLTYGYVLPFNKHWGMEFSVSAGYAKLQYDCFYNIENGAKYTSETMDWWGPTKALISIYYQF